MAEVKAKPPVIVFPALPTKQTLEESKIHQLKWLLYGPPGIGKSTFFSKAEDGPKKPLFLNTDPGLRFIKAMKQPIQRWKQFTHYVKELTITKRKESAKLYSMIVLDTSDLLFRMCRKEICVRRGLEHVSDEQWGKGYDIVKDEFEQEVAKLAKLDESGIGLAFISHAKDVEIRGRTVRTSRLVPTLPKQAHDIIAPMCDIIGYAGFSIDKADRTQEGEKGRIIIFEPDETIEAKDRTGLLPSRCRLDFDAVRESLEGNKEERTKAKRRPQEEEVEESN